MPTDNEKRFEKGRLNLYRYHYDTFIDYIKGVCIILVILNHSISTNTKDNLFFCIWGDLAVPMFLILQVFLSYKRGISKCKFSVKKLWDRVIKWFALSELLLFVVYMLIPQLDGGRGALLTKALRDFGLGPGNYYVFIYVEFAIILYVIRNIIEALRPWQQLCFFLILSEIFEIICSQLPMPQSLYRVFFFRYTFLIWLGIKLVREGVVLSKKSFLFSVLSILCVLWMHDNNKNFQPLIYYSKWKECHWFCYYYISNLSIALLYVSYQFLGKYNKTNLIEKAGRYSLEIFLVQMIYFTIPVRGLLESFMPHRIASFLYPVLSIFICAGGVLSYKKVVTGKLSAM